MCRKILIVFIPATSKFFPTSITVKYDLYIPTPTTDAVTSQYGLSVIQTQESFLVTLSKEALLCIIFQVYT